MIANGRIGTVETPLYKESLQHVAVRACQSPQTVVLSAHETPLVLVINKDLAVYVYSVNNPRPRFVLAHCLNAINTLAIFTPSDKHRPI